MKLKFIKVPLIFSLGSLGLMVTLSGCLKDQTFDDHQSQSFAGSKTQVISLGINVQSPDNFSPYAYDNTFVDTTVDFLPIELGGPNNATGPIQVTVDTSQAILDEYNNRVDDNGDPNPVGPGDLVWAEGVTIVDPVVTIPAGSRIGWLKVKFTPHTYIGQDVALGFRIVSVSPAGYTISGNLATGAIQIVIKNKYDGKYTLRQFQSGWAQYNLADGVTNQWPGTVIFATTGTTTNLIYTSYGGYLQTTFTPTNAVNVFGAATPQYNIDPATEKVTSITNVTPDARNRAFPLNTADDSHYDPATKTLYVSYFLTQNGRAPMTIKDTLVYVGPR